MRVLSRLLAVLALVVPVTFVATPAYAEDKTPPSWRITDYTLTATPDRDGTVRVGLDLSFDFGREAGHGPYIVLPQRQRIADDPDHYRETPVTVERVTSPTGANTALARETKDNQLMVRVGQKGQRYTGVQRYHIDYTVRGLTTPGSLSGGLDEINWNAVGPAWQVPIQKAVVTIQGPAAATRGACFTGKGFDRPCEARTEGDRSVFTATNLPKETGVQVVAGYPQGTFTAAAAPVLSKRSHLGNMFPVTPVSGALTGLVTAVGLALVFLRVRRGRDEAYAGLTPGLAPVGGADGKTVRASGAPKFAVQFTPPRDVRPGEVGTLIDQRADPRDVTATIVDLAVRGHLRIEQLGKKEFVLHKLLCPEQIPPYERAILDTLFTHHEQVSNDDLKSAEFSSLMSGTQEKLYARVVERGWYRANPQRARALTVSAGVALAAAGVGLGLLLGRMAGLGLIGVGLVVVGLVLAATSGMMPSRTADGSAVLAQAKGFEQYLATAEADQIRFEEGVDIFSRYLPYAIVFGVADRWAKVFKELADRGAYEADARWYDSPGHVGFFYGAGLGMSDWLDGLTDSMSSAIQASAATEASSTSGSGFSGGGGFGGGGGGGW